jgi:hypothetical protein
MADWVSLFYELPLRLGPIYIGVAMRRLCCLMLPLASAIRIGLMVELPQVWLRGDGIRQKILKGTGWVLPLSRLLGGGAGQWLGMARCHGEE